MKSSLPALAFLSLACASPPQSSAQPSVPSIQPSAPPKLIVLITIDQMRADYLDKWSSQFTGGLARLTKNGAVFTNAFQDHANSETAPGHATLLSGREPYRTGIVFNTEGVPDPGSPIIGGGGPGASPFRFKGSTLFDWLKYRDSHSRALSVSRKDRGAILPIGHSREAVFWYQSDGRFSTSSYYADKLPDWVDAFNALRIPQSYAGKAWTPLLPLSEYPEPDTVIFEDGGREPAFPHVMFADSAAAARNLLAFPWMDDVTVQFALAGVNAMRLGAGRSTDLLAVSLSSTDAVGHRFGMSSRELHDQILRVDRAVGVLIDSLYKLRDSSTIVFALTADHGVTQMPELAERARRLAAPNSCGSLAARRRLSGHAREEDEHRFGHGLRRRRAPSQPLAPEPLTHQRRLTRPRIRRLRQAPTGRHARGSVQGPSLGRHREGRDRAPLATRDPARLAGRGRGDAQPRKRVGHHPRRSRLAVGRRHARADRVLRPMDSAGALRRAGENGGHRPDVRADRRRQAQRGDRRTCRSVRRS